MNRLSDLKIALLELLKQIDGSGIKLIVGGGFGIYLKSEHALDKGLRTLLNKWPEPRSTNDLDLFLRPELLIHPNELEPLQAALSKLDYEPVPGAAKYQFSNAGVSDPGSGIIKIDFLTGPRASFDHTSVRVGERRARPSPSVGIHAHIVDEAPTLELDNLEIPVEGTLDSGEIWRSDVSVPHPFTFAMMKLFAFRDRIDDPDREFGSYHALDIYSIVATTTEEEWVQAPALREEYKTNVHVIETGEIVSEFFSSAEDMGIIRLKESPYYKPDFQLDDFMSILQELFPQQAGDYM
jgi:hypothetical protein